MSVSPLSHYVTLKKSESPPKSRVTTSRHRSLNEDTRDRALGGLPGAAESWELQAQATLLSTLLACLSLQGGWRRPPSMRVT